MVKETQHRKTGHLWLLSIIFFLLASLPPSMAFAQTITVNDAAAIEGAGLVFTVTLDVAASGPFTVTTGYIDVTATGGTDYNNTPQVISFSGTAGETQQFTVTTTDDGDEEGAETFTVTLTASDPSVTDDDTGTGTITNNDTTASFTAASQTELENVGTMTVTVQLSAQSGLPVTVPYTVSGSATPTDDYTISPASPLSIPAGGTSANITITVNNDGVDEDDEAVIITMGTPTNATQGTPSVHTATITDNDGPPTVSFTAASQSRPEDVGTMTVTAQLSAQSGLPVTVPYTVSGSATPTDDYTISPASPLSIPAGSTSADITITVVNDSDNEPNETVIVTMGSPTNATPGTPSVHTATITDNDAPGVTINEPGGTSVTEGGATDTYSIRLTSNPNSPVTITITPAGSQVTVNPTSLNIAPGANATNPRQVTVTAVDDAVAEGNHSSTIAHSASSNDPDYNNISISNVNVSITDNETAGVNVTPRTVSIVEGSGDATYDVVLTSEPTAPVTITVSPDSQSNVTPSTLTFDPGSGRTPQTVTVTAVDDNLDEGNHTSTITHSAVSADSGYGGITIPNVTANITDNETQSFVTDPVGTVDDPIVVPEGGTAILQVRLSARPLSSVTINATVAKTSGDADITVQSGGTLTFNGTNWDVFQQVTLAAAEDPDGSSDFATVTVSDSGATGIPNKIVTAQESDDDTVTVITPNGGEVWIFGTTREILWDFSPDVTSTVSIELFRNNILELTIDSGATNDGAFTWDIPANLPIGFTYRIRVTATSNSTISDESDGNFSILSSDFDRDLDSIPDAEEMGPDGMDNAYDGNNNGIPDWNEATATSLNNHDGSHYVTIEADGPISNVQPFPPPTNGPAGVSFPYGFFAFEFAASAAGAPATAIIYLDGEIPDTFWKFGATPDDFTPHFYEFLDDGETGAQIDGDTFTVTLLFVDGLRGDDDIQADAVIVDPGGPGVTTAGGDGTGEATGSDCFIATAAFGSYAAPHVQVLRDFRDRHLLTNAPGRWIVSKYYRHSPPYARWLAKHNGARALVRVLLAPIIVTAWVILSAPLIIPLVTVAALTGMICRLRRAGSAGQG